MKRRVPPTGSKKAASLLLLGLAIFSPVQGGSRQQAPPPLQHEVRVALKLVQVIVTDRQGRPVNDLAPGDFEIRDNKKKVDITVFEKHFVPDEGKAAVEEPDGGIANRPTGTNRKFFFIIDAQQSDVMGYALAKKAALHFLETRVESGDEVGLLSFQLRRGLIMHAYLTRDLAHLKTTLEDLRAIPGTGSEGAVTDPYEKEDAAARRMSYVATMRELAQALRAVPGTKNIVFFSAGYARSTLESDVLFQKAFEDMAREFAASSCPVFTVDLMGLRARFMSPDMRGDHSLRTLSDYSGGRYFDDVARTEDVASGIQSATAHFYVLGYSIGEEWDGRRHEIEVAVKREGCLVSAPSGYFSPKPFADFTDFEKQIHLFDAVFNPNPQFETPVELPAVLLPWRDEAGTRLLFLTELPWTGLPDIVLPRAELFTVLTDGENRIIEMKRGDFMAPNIEKKRAVYYGVMSPPAGSGNVILLVRNTATGRIARARATLAAIPPTESSFEMDPPLFLVSETDREVVFLKLTDAGLPAGEHPSPGIKDIFPFLSNRFAPVLDEVRLGTKTMLALVRTRIRDNPDARIEISAALMPDTGGEEIPLDSLISGLEKRGETDVLLIELALPEIGPGIYTVAITAREEVSGKIITIRRTLRII